MIRDQETLNILLDSIRRFMREMLLHNMIKAAQG
jgi:hypothetical protein